VDRSATARRCALPCSVGPGAAHGGRCRSTGPGPQHPECHALAATGGLMNAPRMPYSDVPARQAERFHHLVWFLWSCAEREPLLNLADWAAWWTRAFTPAAARTDGHS